MVNALDKKALTGLCPPDALLSLRFRMMAVCRYGAGRAQNDLHIHTVLSLRGARDDPRKTSAGMVLGLDNIAITDHQEMRQCEAAIANSKALGGPLVIPGMEPRAPRKTTCCACFRSANGQGLRVIDPFHHADRPNRKDISVSSGSWMKRRTGSGRRAMLSSRAPVVLMNSRPCVDQAGLENPAHLDREANIHAISLGADP